MEVNVGVMRIFTFNFILIHYIKIVFHYEKLENEEKATILRRIVMLQKN